MAAAKKKILKVTAPLVAAKVGKQVLHFREGDVLPEGTDTEAVKNLKSLGFVVEEVDSSTDAPADSDEK